MRKIINLLIICLFIVFASCQKSQKQGKQVYENSDQLLEAVKKEINEMPSVDFKKLYDSKGHCIIIDVREPSEYSAGYIPGAVSIPRGLLEFKIGKEEVWDEAGMYIPAKTDSLVLYCRTGGRSALAVRTLLELGYQNVISLQGGWEEWNSKYPELREPVIKKEVAPVEPVAAKAVPLKPKTRKQPVPLKKESAGGC
jgi:rhodanese-related sulfurtransferase